MSQTKFRQPKGTTMNNNRGVTNTIDLISSLDNSKIPVVLSHLIVKNSAVARNRTENNRYKVEFFSSRNIGYIFVVLSQIWSMTKLT